MRDPELVFVNFAVPADLHARIKSEAASRRMTLKELFLEAITKELDNGKMGKPTGRPLPQKT